MDVMQKVAERHDLKVLFHENHSRIKWFWKATTGHWLQILV
jgi:hypothetical protein